MKALLLAPLLAVAACTMIAQQNRRTTAKAASNDGKVVCTEETPTGSNISRVVCKPAERKQSEHDQTQRALERPVSHPTSGQ